MKSLFLAAVLVSSAIGSLALAMPAVNDYADFDATIVQNGQTYQGNFNIKLTAYDAATQNYTEVISQTFQGQTQNRTQSVAANQLYSDAKVADILTNCASYRGQIESMTTGAGTFTTCALPVSGNGFNGTQWVGKVAFGIVKMSVANASGTSQTLALKTFSYGQ